MKKLRHFIGGLLHKIRSSRDKARLLEAAREETDITREEWANSLKDPTAFYARCFRCFHQRLPENLKLHRQYFSQEGRGFGEDAFHTMWWLIFNELRPANFLEIGVYRGQTISLIGLISKTLKMPCEVHAISPFSSAGDSVSKYKTDVDYHTDTLANFNYFDLAEPKLLQAYSTDESARELIKSRLWDCIYIDGNHDYEIAKADWDICSQNVKVGGMIVLDDSALNTDYMPPAFASKGHPGPSQLASEINREFFVEVLHVGHNRVFCKVA